MWIFLSDAFLSIVAHDKRRDLLMVRARAKDDIGRVFPRARVHHTPQHDYQYRAFVPRDVVAKTMAAEVKRICYGNFKNSIVEEDRHDACSEVWLTMMRWAGGAFRRRTQPSLPTSKRWPSYSEELSQDAPWRTHEVPLSEDEYR